MSAYDDELARRKVAIELGLVQRWYNEGIVDAETVLAEKGMSTELTKRFNPDQPRGANGRWVYGGGGSEAAARSAAKRVYGAIRAGSSAGDRAHYERGLNEHGGDHLAMMAAYRRNETPADRAHLDRLMMQAGAPGGWHKGHERDIDTSHLATGLQHPNSGERQTTVAEGQREPHRRLGSDQSPGTVNLRQHPSGVYISHQHGETGPFGSRDEAIAHHEATTGQSVTGVKWLTDTGISPARR